MYPYAINRDYDIDPEFGKIYSYMLNSGEIGRWIYEVACYDSCPPQGVEPNPSMKKFTVEGKEHTVYARPDMQICNIGMYYKSCQENSSYNPTSDYKAYSTFGSLERYGEEIVPIVGRLKYTAYGLAMQYARNHDVTINNMEDYIEYHMNHIDWVLRNAASIDPELIKHVTTRVCDVRCSITYLPEGGYGTVPECDYPVSGMVMPVTYSSEVCEIAKAMEKCIDGPEKNYTKVYIILGCIAVAIIVIIIVSIMCCVKCYKDHKRLKELERNMSSSIDSSSSSSSSSDDETKA